MAISEICKFEVKKEIDECVSKGMSRNKASKWLADIFADALGRPVSANTIRSKDQRARKRVDANASKKSKAQNPKMPSALDGKIKDIIKDLEALKYKLIKVNGSLVDIQTEGLQLAFKKELECLQDPIGKILKEYQEAGY